MAKDRFFEIMEQEGLALTFEDVRLKTGYCSFRPDELSFKTRFSRRVGLNIPIVSAAMDTVTEAEMAIELAKLGGLGVIHYNLSPKEQQAEARRVWFHLNGRIERPVTVQSDRSVESVQREREERELSFHSFPVLDSEQHLVGVLARNDFDFCEDLSLPVAKVMTTDLITGSPDTSLDQAYDIMRREKKKILPLADAENHLMGMYVFSDVQRIKTGSSQMYNLDEQGHLRCAAAVGIGDDAFERIKLLGRYVSVILINKAHADFADYLETVRAIKKHSWDHEFDIATGNISEGESARRLVDAGSDCIVVGQGGGSICISSIIAGYGCGQITAVHNVAKAIAGSGVPVCSDGGARFSGDIVKAIGAQADSVMLGLMLAGTKQAPGKLMPQVVAVKGPSGETTYQTILMKNYRGMGSPEAMRDAAGSPSRYTQGSGRVKVAHGVNAAVAFQGELHDVVAQYLGGMQDGMLTVGARTIPELQEKGDFYRITNAGARESHPHDVIMLSEPPNYRRSGT